MEEDKEERILAERKEQIKTRFKNWLKNPYNKIFLIIFIAIVGIRIYYFSLTINQPLWWDEAEYLAMAKTYAGIVTYDFPEQRLPGFPLLVSLFYRLGIMNEIFLKFIFSFLPSILAIFLLYVCVKEMYPDRKIALCSLVIMGVLWEHLFYSNRFHTENLALIFEFLAIIVLFKVYMKKEKLLFISPKYSLIWILIFSFLSIFMRPGNTIFIPAIFIFFLLLNQGFFFKKGRKIYSSIGLIAIIIFFFLFVIYLLPNVPLFGTYYHPEWELAWHNLSIFKSFYVSVIPWLPAIFYYAVLFGIIVCLIKTLLIINLMGEVHRDTEKLEFKSNLFNLILLFSVLAYFIFILRNPDFFELRWFFPFLPAMLAFTSKGILTFSDYISHFLKNKKLIAVLFIIVLLSLGSYNQIAHADSIIKIKKDSYIQIKEAGLWLKENSNSTDIVLSRSRPQTAYYSERRTYGFGLMNESQFLDLVNRTHPRYVLESGLEPNPPVWGYGPPPESIQKILNPVQVWFTDAEKKQAILIVYEVKY